MMTSKQREQTLCSLLFRTTSNYSDNLTTLLKLINEADENSLIVAPEVCLTGYDYAYPIEANPDEVAQLKNIYAMIQAKSLSLQYLSS